MEESRKSKIEDPAGGKQQENIAGKIKIPKLKHENLFHLTSV